MKGVAMSFQELLNELDKLSQIEKIRVVQHLVNHLTIQAEMLLEEGKHYEIWSPMADEAAAETLLDMLRAAEENKNG
jgi:hypothetical protein